MSQAAHDPARRAAVDVVLAVDRDDAFANLLLPRLLRERGLTGVDAAFATELAYGALRRCGVLDVVIAAGARRDVDALDPPVRAVLRVGAYQLLHTRVPPHAAVAATVEVSKQVAGPRTAGLVNAVLRRVAEHGWDWWVERLAADEDALGRLAFARGYPRWIAAALLDALGGDEADLDSALTDERPSVHLLAKPGRITRDALLAAAGQGASAGPWSPYAVRMERGNPAALTPVRDGRAAVQDEGSQLVALGLARAAVGPDERGNVADLRWLDACAGPGGKASLLAGLLPDGAHLLAAERAAHRARLVAQALARGSRTAVVVADATRPPWGSGGFDRVLVDAPCSGLGALRRRPELRWRRRPDDVERLHALQCELLGGAVDSVRSGGVVGYATCSPHRRETVDTVAAVTAARDDVEILDATLALPQVPDVGSGPHVQLWPHRHGTDAMFLALLRRRSSH